MDATPSILEILDARCGDMLKAYVLKQYYPSLNINLLMVRQPAGEAEAAFAAERAERAPETISKRLMEEFKSDHDKKFENVDPVAEARRSAAKLAVVNGKPQWATEDQAIQPSVEALPANVSPSDGEFEVDGKIYVTREIAAKLRGCKEGSITVAAINNKWSRLPHPEDGRKNLFLKEDVVLARRRRKACQPSTKHCNPSRRPYRDPRRPQAQNWNPCQHRRRVGKIP